MEVITSGASSEIRPDDGASFLSAGRPGRWNLSRGGEYGVLLAPRPDGPPGSSRRGRAFSSVVWEPRAAPAGDRSVDVLRPQGAAPKARGACFPDRRAFIHTHVRLRITRFAAEPSHGFSHRRHNSINRLPEHAMRGVRAG